MRIGNVELPHELRIERRGPGQPAKLYIDGVHFAYATADGFHVDVRRGDMPGVTLTLVADSVLVTDTIDMPKEDRPDAAAAGEESPDSSDHRD